MQRLLTTTEQANFLMRHPVVAARVATTKAALLSGAYDFTAPEWGEIDINLLDVIPPQGLAVNDQYFDLVVIQPAPNREIYFNAFVTSTTAPTINDDTYNSPTVPPSDCDWLCQLGNLSELVQLAAIIGIGLYAYNALTRK